MKKQSFIIRYSAPLLFALSLFSSGAAQSEPVDNEQREQQRELFKKAEYAAKRGRLNEYRQLLQELEGYPLVPYLELARLEQVGYLANEDRVLAFLEKYDNTPLDWQLRQPWLTYLAGQEEHARFIRDFRHPGTLTHRCQFIEAQREKGLEDGPFRRQVDAIWEHGFSLPSACDPILKEWENLNGRTDEKIWNRVELAAEHGNPTLLPYLTGLLPELQQYLGEFYHKVRYSPAAIEDGSWFKGRYPEKEAQITAFALTKLIWRDEDIALRSYKKLKPELPFSEAQEERIAEEFAVALSLKSHPEARVWHDRVPVNALNERVLQWRLAIYLKDKDYEGLRDAIQSLPVAIRQGNQWRYWLARTQEITGNALVAQQLYEDLSDERHYYGFLASARLQKPVSLEHEKLEVSVVQLEQIRNHPSVQRAYELIQLERWVDARREWNHLLTQLDGEEQKVAAYLASEWGWHDQAIWTLAQIGHFDAVGIRFPLAYKDILGRASQAAGIDENWALAITRRESNFRHDAYSSAGARGLMQILPGTAKQLDTKNNSWRRLNDPSVNVRLGTHYLSRLKHRFENNWLLATASYNAGYYRVREWLPEEPVYADEWVETIPYHETRDYVKAVLSYQQIYRMLGGNEDNLFEQVVDMTIVETE
ncbi:transglycosylase SLT domain-containing protein [Idiomarina abyssalis]|uniref:transglycosylase SLT domain-containing protein n=1 Tax=Idiomarina abyssalis TaxID=86102 RepID=UPI0006C8647B|nr:transglycosylase SLT domain-containing protein [Idiomarina abyssalis]KPD21961.1 murein transglycosylase [Idiomarina abyssalis]SFT65132.1 soluble lytic murein transglycosylase [Idiomarina abyssalis]